MNRIRQITFALSLIAPLTLLVAEAHAFCGVIQETGEAQSAVRAEKRTAKLVFQQVKTLRKQYGTRLSLDDMSMDCLGGERVYNKNGNLKNLHATCVAVLPYCVSR
jgi:hypothetical protein